MQMLQERLLQFLWSLSEYICTFRFSLILSYVLIRYKLCRYHTNMDLPEGRTVEDTQCAEAETWLPPNVRTLRSRWRPGMNFGEFSNATFAAFH